MKAINFIPRFTNIYTTHKKAFTQAHTHTRTYKYIHTHKHTFYMID